MKKLLALVLALVMTLGLATVSSSAAYSDAADVSLNEAVDVMSAVGVFQGADGKFAPKANLNREQAAKLIAYLDLGENAAEALPAVKVFSDVPATSWSAKYIAYCADAGYIAGDGTGKFNPTGELNGYAFGKMLLCVLGYDADIEGFVGNSWSINVAKLMEKNDIADGISSGASLTLTREQAAQYCLNALKANMVDYENKGTNVTINGAVIATGASKAEAVKVETEGTKNYAGKETTDAGYGYQQLCEKLYGTNLKLADSKDAFGRSADKWSYKTKSVGTYTTETPVLTYTAEVKGGTLYTDLGKPTKADDKQATYTLYVDGKTVDAPELAIKSGDTKKLGGNGTLIEVYETDTTGVYKIVVINTYVGEIKTWNAAKTDKNGDITDKEYVTLAKVGADVTNKFETTAFTKDDKGSSSKDPTVVYYTMAWNGNDKYEIKSMTAATSADLAISSSTGSSFVGGGTTYKYAANKSFDTDVVTNAAKVAYSKDAEFTAFFDAYGYVLTSKEVSSSDTTGYAVVLAVAQNDKTWSDDSQTYSAKIVKADGETVVVKCNKTSYDAIKDLNEKALVKYSVNSKDVYSFTTNDKLVSAASNLDINQGKAAMTNEAGETVNANSDTIFFVGKTGTDADKTVTWTVYTGIANVPSYEKKDGAKYAEIIDTTAKAVAILDAKLSSTTTKAEDIAYVQYKSSPTETTDADGTYYTYNAVIGGEITTVKVAKTYAATLFGGSDNVLKAGLEYTDNMVTGVVSSFDSKTAAVARAKITTELSKGIIGIGSSFYSVSDDVAVFAADNAEGTIEAGTTSDLDKGLYVIAVTVDDVITTIFVETVAAG